jgi:hypothetical protein
MPGIPAPQNVDAITPLVMTFIALSFQTIIRVLLISTSSEFINHDMNEISRENGKSSSYCKLLGGSNQWLLQ